MKSRYHKKFFILLTATTFIFNSCSKNPVTGENELHFVSESQEIAIGEQNYRYMIQAEGGPYVTDPDVEEYVEKVGKKIAAVSDRPQLPYEFTVLNNSIPNAWALPGGKIAIYRGLLFELHSEAELAAVLAHEIVHSAARHGAKAFERAILMEAGIVGLSEVLGDHKYEDTILGSAAVGATLVAFKYSRSAELEADKYGIKYMVAAGYDPEAAVQLQETFIKLKEDKSEPWLAGLFATHPPSEERLKANEATVAQYPKGGFEGVKQYNKAMAGLLEARPAYEDLDKGYEWLARGNAKKALELAEDGIKIESKEAHLYNLKGKALYHLGQYQSALYCFSEAIDLNPGYFDFYLQRGLLEYKMGDYASAEKDLAQSNLLLPSAESYYTLGEIYVQQKQYSLARKNYEIAAQAHNSTGAAARRKLGQSASPQYSSKSSTKAISVSADCNSGSVVLTLTNRGRNSVRNLEIEITFFNKKKHVLQKTRVLVPDTIPGSSTLTKRTNIYRPSKTRSCQAILIRAEAVS